MSITVEGLSKSFGRLRALDAVDLTVGRGTLTALLGPSGCGKTTLLRILAGLERPDSGRIAVEGVDITDVPLGRRDVGFVFQSYALFPHLSVAENVAFALESRKRPPRERARRVAELLALVHLEGFEARRPHQLSGGQRQRVALARALAAEPSILLLDEPFAALDLHVRRNLRRALRELHERTHVTTVLVTHDSEEAMDLADEIVVMREGTVQQAGPPHRVYNEPVNPFVMRFLGDVNAVTGAATTIYVRPQDFRVDRHPFGEASAAAVERVIELGARTHVELLLDDGQRLVTELSEARAATLGARPGTTLYLEPTRIRTFDRNGAPTPQ